MGSSVMLGIGEKREALELALRSLAFSRSEQLRSFLRFVCEMEIAGRASEINEYRVGVEALGRPASYSTGEDSAVRRRAHALREKLEELYSAEAADCDVRIELPKGSYVPRFVPAAPDREAAEPMGEPAAAPAPVTTPRRWARWPLVGFGLALAAVMASGALWVKNQRLETQLAVSYTPPVVVAEFWREMVGNGRPTYMVLADANLTLFQNEIKRNLTLSEYEGHRMNRIASERIADPRVRTMAEAVAARRFTGVQDASAARKLGALFAAERLPLDIVSGRDITIAQIATSNAILTGSRRSNPWLELFEDSLNFQTVFEEAPRHASFVNRKPLAGEDPAYHDDWTTVAYCRLAYLPNPRGTGSAVLISGTMIAATESGGEFITDERRVTALRNALGLRPGDRLPYFEALVRTRIVNATVSSYELVAVRRH